MTRMHPRGVAVRKLALLLLLAGFGSPAVAATGVTVEQFEQVLAASYNLPDAKLATKISSYELVERVSSSRLSHWQDQFPGKRAQEALLALADAASFLDLPLSEFVAQPEPDRKTQNDIFQKAVAYANTTLKKLPNFSARRTTTHFDNISPLQRVQYQQNPDRMGWLQSTRAPPAPPSYENRLVRVGDPSSAVVTYRDGEEVTDVPTPNDKKPAPPVLGLTTTGEFGPHLATVTGDAAHGKLLWSHWEQGANGLLAVFRFLVRQENSHFTVTGTGNMSPHPSYHGEIAVDPATGTILRVTAVSDWKPPFQPSQAAMLVEYGPVQIGNATYTCPIKGVGLSLVPNATTGNGGQSSYPLQTFVNDVTFTEYHVFRGEIRIIP